MAVGADPDRARRGFMRHLVLAAAALLGTVLTLPLAACGTSTTPGSAYNGVAANTVSGVVASATSVPSSSRSSSGFSAVLTVRKTAIGYVLADANGHTIYWYAKDPRGSSRPACTGSCLLVWFPVTGRPVAAKGFTLLGVLGTIPRPGGSVQATYNGYPLYTFASDDGPGQTNGSNSGGVWHVIREKAPAGMAAGG
jgi:predicted lipoprotein with Yx(FWY)xxD motif